MGDNRYIDLADFGKRLLNASSLEEGLPLISNYSKSIIHAERCSIFIHDQHKNELWTILADGVQRITISADKGIASKALELKQTLITNDTNKSPDFLSEVDQKSGFKTKNIIATPVFNTSNEVIGILELLNKEGGFTKEDERFMHFFANFISGYIELATFYKNR